ncbi:hypothetical protein RHMOL_Rhmol11G0016700 [Rhododendron molle]|uniref:Uncharacterized protein n=1 Tax=Rhododendron molle TaxID=49168 RepID=A0ACC0LNR0_RHOML|nr:hypothetical protein RHMOL_Rhmol11G0016700 [Rhododendron molle]
MLRAPITGPVPPISQETASNSSPEDGLGSTPYLKTGVQFILNRWLGFHPNYINSFQLIRKGGLPYRVSLVKVRMIKKSKHTCRVLIYPKILRTLSVKISLAAPRSFNYSPPKFWLRLGHESTLTDETQHTRRAVNQYNPKRRTQHCLSHREGALGDYVGQAHRRFVLSICALTAYMLIPAVEGVSPSLVSIALQMDARCPGGNPHGLRLGQERSSGLV